MIGKHGERMIKQCPERIFPLHYVPGIAEYASQVRDEIRKRAGSDFLIAVDLPAGYEAMVIDAVQKLPEVSIIVDEIGKGIPVIPTSPPVEAVRSYQEQGLDLGFIAPSLPVVGNSDEVPVLMRILSFDTLPRQVTRKRKAFDIFCYRYDDPPRD